MWQGRDLECYRGVFSGLEPGEIHLISEYPDGI